MSARRLLRSLESRLRRLLLGRHPYNTIFNYNWVNVRPMIRTFRELQDVFQGQVVDLGAGASPYYDLIAPMAKSYIAIDREFSFPEQEVRGIKRVAATMESLPLTTESIDTVLCTQAIYQMLYPIDALREVARILRPGGYAVFSVPHISPIHSEPNDLYRFTPDGFRKLAEAAGLHFRSVHVQGQLFSSFALCFAMSLVLSPVVPGQSMQLLPRRQLLFAPLIALVNGISYLLDAVLPFNRTPVNFIIVMTKSA